MSYFAKFISLTNKGEFEIFCRVSHLFMHCYLEHPLCIITLQTDSTHSTVLVWKTISQTPHLPPYKKSSVIMMYKAHNQIHARVVVLTCANP